MLRRATRRFNAHFFHLLNNLTVSNNILVAAQLAGAEVASRVPLSR